MWSRALFLCFTILGSLFSDGHQVRRRPIREYPTKTADYDMQLVVNDVNKLRTLAVYFGVIDHNETLYMNADIYTSTAKKSELVGVFRKHFDKIPIEKRAQTFAYLKEIENLFNDLDISLQVECEDLHVILRKMRRAQLIPPKNISINECEMYNYDVHRLLFNWF